MPFPDASAHLQVPGNPLLSKMDMLFYTSPVYFAAFFSLLHIPVSYHSTSDYIKNDSSQMFLQAELPVLCLDIYENGKLYSSFFLSLRLDIITDNINRCPTRCQQAETLAPECFLPKSFPDLWIFLF